MDMLPGLLHDLERRCQTICQRFSASAEPDLQEHAIAGYYVIEHVRREVVQLLADPGLEEPKLRANHLQMFSQWDQQLSTIESLLLPFIERYTKNDQRMTNLCTRILHECNWPTAEPLLGLFSNQYYWTVADLCVICLPSTADSTMLSWPDLLHELGHILMGKYEDQLIGDFRRQLIHYIHQERRRIKTDNRPKEYYQKYDLLYTLWNDEWLFEFVADMVASYLGGVMFGWQHIRLCSSVRRGIFTPGLGESATHPADQARLDGIVAVLNALGEAQVATQLLQEWQQFAALKSEQRPTDYDLCYPAHLIDTLAKEVVAGCRQLGLIDYRSMVDEPTVIGMMQHSWRIFRERSADHSAWEKPQLEELWSS